MEHCAFPIENYKNQLVTSDAYAACPSAVKTECQTARGFKEESLVMAAAHCFCPRDTKPSLLWQLKRPSNNGIVSRGMVQDRVKQTL